MERNEIRTAEKLIKTDRFYSRFSKGQLIAFEDTAFPG